MSKVMPIFIEDEKAIKSFEKYNFSKELLKKVEEYLTIKLGIDIKFYESSSWTTYLTINTDTLDIKYIGIFDSIIKEYCFHMVVFPSSIDNKCTISFDFNYEHYSGGNNGSQLNFYLVGYNKTNMLKEVKR